MGLGCLKEKFETINSNAAESMEAYLSEALPIVSKKVISKGAFYNVRPYEVERAGFKKGCLLKKLPENIKNTHVYNLDERDRIVFVEVYGQSENIVSKEFYKYDDASIERTHFTSVGRLRNISLSVVEGGLIYRDLNWGAFGCSDSVYEYSGTQLEKIMVRQKEHADSEFSEFEVVFEYSGDELLRIVNVFPNGYQEQRFPS
ncbi:hypothetical protein [Pseudomonas sp. GD03746]|uniref:hypothetical protein n=1 Tax=Pseudomonas sp. GD03746 TaxID=2975378 RepID=UPI002446A34A|nr:hypothetical protein [Pseudomonas sp. GD03746]MDH1576622.1 hypothetical protein [Pseudomonas sp. GD03746]